MFWYSMKETCAVIEWQLDNGFFMPEIN